MRHRTALVALLICTTSACTVFPAARDVLVTGQVTDQRGEPVSGLAISYVVLRNRPGMPGTSESGVVITDALGRYRVSIRRVYDVVSISEPGSTYRCWMLMSDVAGEAFRKSPVVVRDFICHAPQDQGGEAALPTVETTELTGVLRQRTEHGPPGWSEDPANDSQAFMGRRVRVTGVVRPRSGAPAELLDLQVHVATTKAVEIP